MRRFQLMSIGIILRKHSKILSFLNLSSIKNPFLSKEIQHLNMQIIFSTEMEEDRVMVKVMAKDRMKIHKDLNLFSRVMLEIYTIYYLP